jgi:hydroxymethylbilane synthase
VRTLTIGTRGSQLALWQARTVARLIAESGGPTCELAIIRTAGDERPGPPEPPADTPAAVNVKATFVKEIEDALLDRRVDIAVHSSKDLAAVFPHGLIIGATLAREDPRDALLLPNAETVESVDALRSRLGERPVIGTSSVRRAAQLRALFPSATFKAIRGNVDTRLRKLDAGECDAGVLASAGLKRLGLAHRISLALPVEVCVPAPGQGIVAAQIREDDAEVARIVDTISDRAALDALRAERAIVRALGGGCQMPLGAYATITSTDLAVRAVVIAADGTRVIRDQAHGRRADAVTIGQALARSLLDRGAGDILSASK